MLSEVGWKAEKHAWLRTVETRSLGTQAAQSAVPVFSSDSAIRRLGRGPWMTTEKPASLLLPRA